MLRRGAVRWVSVIGHLNNCLERGHKVMVLICPFLVNSKIDRDSESIDKVENLIQYEYKYNVDEGQRSGPVMDRWERRLGEYVKGAYSVLQPDGSIRTVDYEVDGDKGYHAVTRLSLPSTKYLSSQQLSRSHELFPDVSLQVPENIETTTDSPPQPDISQELINYHSKHPYINKRAFKDQKSAASTNIATAIVVQKIPPSPANYNLPPSKLIYFKSPAGKILPHINLPQMIFDIDAILPSNPKSTHIQYSTGITNYITKPGPPVKRYSKLVKRYNSLDNIFN